MKWGLRFLGQEEVRNKPLIPIRRGKGDLLPLPVVSLLNRFDNGMQRRFIVRIQALVHPEQRIGNGLLAVEISDLKGYGIAGFADHGSGSVLRAAETKIRSSLEWRPGIPIVEHVERFVPCAAQNIASARTGLVPAPLFNVPSHVVSPKPAHSSEASHSGWSLSAKIAGRHNTGARPWRSGRRPMINGRERLACEFRVSRCLIPTHT